MTDGNEEWPGTEDCPRCGGTFLDSFSACPRCDRPHELLAELGELADDWEEYGEAADEACAKELRGVIGDYE